jgi:hypothetical protein
LWTRRGTTFRGASMRRAQTSTPTCSFPLGSRATPSSKPTWRSPSAAIVPWPSSAWNSPSEHCRTTGYGAAEPRMNAEQSVGPVEPPPAKPQPQQRPFLPNRPRRTKTVNRCPGRPQGPSKRQGVKGRSNYPGNESPQQNPERVVL